ncbi:hypothetical protein F5884DRAFT_836427 [Xylogone sp. PMI_703]|nr:hypothetical protein F5884DRAFT_836427 [Xylogone sp. PMI_703]
MSGFNPTTDIVNLNWAPDLEYKCWNDDGSHIPELIWLSSISRGASVTADLIYSFQIGPTPCYPFFDYRRDLKNFELLEGGKNYLVVVKIVIIHTTIGHALENDLFGQLCEERVVLVDPTDEETIRRYHTLWITGQPQDREPAKFFEEAIELKTFCKRVERWKYELKVYWLRFKCFHAEATGILKSEDVEEIFYNIRPVDWDGERAEYLEGPGANWENCFTENHPFLQTAFQDMPLFSPKVMFRLCEMNCYEVEAPKDY